jgi:transcription elongation factor Elf1
MKLISKEEVESKGFVQTSQYQWAKVEKEKLLVWFRCPECNRFKLKVISFRVTEVGKKMEFPCDFCCWKTTYNLQGVI